jgi:hypothetical protein
MVLSIVLVAIGAFLLTYGLFAKSNVASSGEQGQVAPASEMAMTREVARGGVKRDESGQVKKTYEEGQKAPAACPT